jgi:hypothetical protein
MNRPRPKLLVATEFAPNALGGGPAVVRQMLKEWPEDKIDWWSCLPEPAKTAGWSVARHAVAKVPPKLYPHRRATHLKAWLLDRLWSPWAARHLRATIAKFQPDVIWAIPHQWSISPLAATLSSADIPYHVSIHDFPDAHHPERKIGRKIAHCLVTLTQDLYLRATTRDVIWHQMADDLHEKTGRPADQILHAGLEQNQFERLQQKTSPARSKIKIAYAGTIVADQTFACFMASLGRVRHRLIKPIELHFFGAYSYRSRPWFDSSWMFEHGDVTSEELHATLQEFDWGFAPMELTDENPRYNRFSLPTKAVSYLAAGLGLISMGHRDSTIAGLARKYSLGIAIEESNANEIDLLLTTGLSEKDVWTRWRNEILRCAHAEFDATAMRKELYRRLGGEAH